MVRVRGVIAEKTAGSVFQLRDSTGTIQVQSRATSPVAKGDSTEVIGVRAENADAVYLRNAVLHALGHPGERTAPSANRQSLRTTAASVLQLPGKEARREYPVRIEGVVTYVDPSWQILFVQDETAGIFVEAESVAWDRLETSQRVSVTGTTDAGDFAPIIQKGTVEVLGEGSLPDIPAVPLRRLLSGQEDA